MKHTTCTKCIAHDGTFVGFCPLHAAAPEMLEALKLAIAESEMYLGCEDLSGSDAEVMFRNILETAKTAIRKAKGK